METFSLDYALCTCLLLFALGCGVWFYFFCRAQRIKKVLQTLGSAAEVYAGILRQEKLRREQAYREQLRREAERRRQEEIRREQAFCFAAELLTIRLFAPQLFLPENAGIYLGSTAQSL